MKIIIQQQLSTWYFFISGELYSLIIIRVGTLPISFIMKNRIFPSHHDNIMVVAAASTKGRPLRNIVTVRLQRVS